jgi:hypothetical protein
MDRRLASLFLVALLAGCAAEADGPSVELDGALGAGKDDALAGLDLQLYPDPTSLGIVIGADGGELAFDGEVVVEERSRRRLVLAGDWLGFDLRAAFEKTERVCTADPDCADLELGSCRAGACQALVRPDYTVRISLESLVAGAEQGFVLFNKFVFPTPDFVVCDGQSVFRSLEVDFTAGQVKVDDARVFDFADCRLEGGAIAATNYYYAALAVPLTDDGVPVHRHRFHVAIP